MKNPLIFRRRPFFFFLVFTYLWTENPFILQRRLFLTLRIFVRKRVPPQNPAPGATILSKASASINVNIQLKIILNMQWLRQGGCEGTARSSSRQIPFFFKFKRHGCNDVEIDNSWVRVPNAGKFFVTMFWRLHSDAKIIANFVGWNFPFVLLTMINKHCAYSKRVNT